MKRIKRWLVCYLFPLALLVLLGWLVWQQCLFDQALKNQNVILEQLESQIQAMRTPKVIQDENKHYQQMAYLVLVDRSDLDLGSAYLDVLKANYSETNDRKRSQEIKVLKDQVDTLRSQVKNRTKLITELQSQLSKPGKQKDPTKNGWFRPLKGWINVEYHEGKPGSIDPQQWRYWSTLEQARWYLVHGHYDDYLDAISSVQSWVKLYPGDVDWQNALQELAKPLQALDLTTLSEDYKQTLDLNEKVAQRQRLLKESQASKKVDETNEKKEEQVEVKTEKPRHGVIA